MPGEVCGQLVRGGSKRRRVRMATEAIYDAAAWVGGLLTVGRATSDLAEAHMTAGALGFRTAGICAVAAGCGLSAGLYRGRYLRGSRDGGNPRGLAAFPPASRPVVSG